MAREGCLKVSSMPWRKGLATAGQQTSIPEDALWQSQDMYAGLDGLLQKRPGLRQWGQDIVQGTITEPLIDESLPNWVEANDDTTLLSKTVRQGKLRMSAQAGASNETLTLSRAGTVATDASIRLIVQVSNVNAYTASSTDADTFHFRVAKDATTGWEFAVWSGGLYYKQASDDTYVVISGTSELGLGKWSLLDIRIDADGNTLVYMDSTLVATLTTSDLATPSLTDANAVMELAAQVDPTVTYNATVILPMWSGTASDPWTAQTIKAITDFRSSVGSGTLRRTLMCAAGDFIYHDADLLEQWRPIARLTYDNVTFSPYRRKMLWVEHDGLAKSKLWQWTGGTTDEPEVLDDAPKCKFATEHQTRVWVAGDRRHPLRIYYSGDREPNVWFAPEDNNISDRFDTQLKAGYLEVPSRRGDEVTAIFGDYYGQLIVFTKQAVYRIQGSGPQSYTIQTVSQDVGCENFDCITQVGNDVWFLSREGLHSLSATDKFGDLVSGFVSGPIQDLWGGDPSSVRAISKTHIDQARVRYNSVLGLVYVAVPLFGDQTAAKVFTYNVTTQEWYGPWQIDSRAMDKVELASPVIEVVMHGGSAGQLLYTDLYNKSDNGTAISMVLESAKINGRTLDPKLAATQKTWKRLRVYFLPRGDWDIKVFWRTDDTYYEDEGTKLSKPDQFHSTNVFKKYGIGQEWRIGEDPEGRLVSREDMGYIEVPLGGRGYSMSFKLTQDGDGEDVAIQGFEVDFIPDGYERE